MEVETEPSETPTVVDLVTSLEQATLMTKQLPTSTDPSHLFQILTSLHFAHHHLSLFLSHHPPPPFPIPHTPPPENSISSAVVRVEENEDAGGGEPMLVGDDEDEVVGRMRECFIQNKRQKRQLSPSAAVAELRRTYEYEAERDGPAMGPTTEFDPLAMKLRSLDLIYQFHA